MEPAAFRPNLAMGQRIDGGGQYLNDASDQAAVGAVEVRTKIGLAFCRYPKDLGRMSGSRHCEHIRRGRQRLIQVGDLEAVAGLLKDSEHTSPFHLGL
jgi:hypothetical protein